MKLPFGFKTKIIIFTPRFDGQIAQSVEQRTENPCVGGSIPSLPTLKCEIGLISHFFCA